MTKNKILCYIATLGALLTATGCTTTYQVGDNFRAPAPRARVAYEQKMPRRTPAVIVAQPLQVQTVVERPVYVAPAVAVPVVGVPVCRPAYHHGGRGYYGSGFGGRNYPNYNMTIGNGRPNINPTGGTHLGNTLDGTTTYYREYQ